MLIARDELDHAARAILESAGARSSDARLVTEHLIESDIQGLRSHGVLRIPQYVDEIARGDIDPRTTPVVTRQAAARSVVDGRRGFGQVVGMAMVSGVRG